MNENTIIYTARNPVTRKHEIIDVETAELPKGTPVLKWFAAMNQQGSRVYVTVPGASAFYAEGRGGLIAAME